MHIQENINNYRIVVNEEDLLNIGQTIEELINNLSEASELCNKPLGEFTQTYDPKDRTWVIYIEKEKNLVWGTF